MSRSVLKHFHFIQRARERYQLEITPNEIEGIRDSIQQNKGIVLSRRSKSRSMQVVLYNNIPLPVIYCRKLHKVLTCYTADMLNAEEKQNYTKAILLLNKPKKDIIPQDTKKYSLAEVFSWLAAWKNTNKSGETITINEEDTKISSNRLNVFQLNHKCIHCGCEGSFMKRLRTNLNGRYHLNMYGVKNGREVLFSACNKKQDGNRYSDPSNFVTVCADCLPIVQEQLRHPIRSRLTSICKTIKQMLSN